MVCHQLKPFALDTGVIEITNLKKCNTDSDIIWLRCELQFFIKMPPSYRGVLEWASTGGIIRVLLDIN